MANIEAEVISAVCENKDISTALTAQIDDMFISHADVWEALKSYYYRHGSVPSTDVLVRQFDDFAPESVSGPTDYYVDLLRDSFVRGNIKNYLLDAGKELRSEPSRLVLDKLQSQLSKLSQYTSVAGDIDLSDFESAKRHYEQIHDSSEQNGGNVGIMTGLKAFDASVPTGLAPGNLVILLGYSGRGKAEPVNKLIPTPNGYKYFGELEPGDTVFGSDGKPTQVLQIHPQGFLREHVVSFNDGTTGIFSGNHLWTGINGETLTTEQIMRRGQPFVLPLPKPVQYRRAMLAVDPYTAGVMVRNSPRSLYEILPDNEQVRRPNGFGVHYKYLTGSIDQREQLLSGIIDETPVHGRRRPRFATSQRMVAEGLVSLVRSLGGVAKSIPTNDAYEVEFWTPHNPYSKRSKYYDNYNPKPWFKSILAVGQFGWSEMQCITVEADDHLYLTEDYTVTHNTWLAGYLAAQAYSQGKKPMVVSMEMTAQAMRDRIYSTMANGSFYVSDFQTGAIDTDDFNTWGRKQFKDKQSFTVVSSEGLSDISVSTLQGKIDQHQPDLVVVDYIQLMSDGAGNRNETEKIRNISRGLKRLALRNNVPVVAISAVTSAELNAPDSPPMLEQVSWSRSIQFDADLAVAVHKYDDTNIVECVSRKNRFGPDFGVYLEVDFSRGLIKETFAPDA